ncbi:MAG TPA: YqgE/AlgH family protein [Burkholderiales bacterium]|nr:YqgE/AlgH family protein [Burkholderiales bacterium]
MTPGVIDVERGELTAFCAYAGYSAWAPGQLQSEILRGGWYMVQADA